MTDPAVPHVAAELEPRFLVTVTLDGDEWPPAATEQAEIELRRVLATIDLRGGVIRAYTIERAPVSEPCPASVGVTAQARMGRRVGRWQYERGIGWRLDDTELVLDFDPLDGNGDLMGCYMLHLVPHGEEFSTGVGEPIDHYLRDAMDFVEQRRERGLT